MPGIGKNIEEQVFSFFIGETPLNLLEGNS